jgi:hypothetical protein
MPYGGRRRGMHYLNGAYSAWFNENYGHRGRVLQGPYHPVLIDDDEQLLTTIRYVLLNAWAADLCSHPADWRWCSYSASVGDVPAPAFLARTELLSLFAPDEQRAVRQLRRFVDDGMADPDSSGAKPPPWPLEP